MPELMRLLPDKPVYRTANGVKSLKGHYHQGWNFQVVKTGDTLSLGKKEVVFIGAPMPHRRTARFFTLNYFYDFVGALAPGAY